MKRVLISSLTIIALSLMIVPTLVFAGTNQVLNDNNILKWILGLAGTGFVGSIGIIVKLRSAIKEITEFIVVLKTYLEKQAASDELRVVKKEAHEAVDSIADVLEKVKLKKHAEKLRNLV